MVMIIPAYAIHLSTRCRLSISFKTEFDRPTVFRTSKAFLWALCNAVKMAISRHKLLDHYEPLGLIIFSNPLSTVQLQTDALSWMNNMRYLQSIPLVSVLVKDSHSCLISFFKHSWGVTSWLLCLGFVIKYSENMWRFTILRQQIFSSLTKQWNHMGERKRPYYCSKELLQLSQIAQPFLLLPEFVFSDAKNAYQGFPSMNQPLQTAAPLFCKDTKNNVS